MMSGYLSLGRVAGASVYVHWTALIVLFVFGGLSPGGWLGLAIVVLAHEFGHALAVRAVGAYPRAIVVHGLGGHCEWVGSVGKRERGIIAWGGVAAQLVLFVATAVISTLSPPSGPFAHALVWSLLWGNLQIAALNLLPIPPLDGAEAWPLFGVLIDDLRRGSPAKRSRSSPRPPATVEEPELTDRITDRETSERLFKKVYDGIHPPKAAEPADDDGEGR